jgi:hypothetical protein
MGCHWIKIKNADGTETTMHINMATPRKRRCAHCGCPDAKALCDWPVKPAHVDANGNTVPAKTCDKPCCFRCRRHVAENVDYCKDHWGEGSRQDAVQRELFDVHGKPR